LVGASRNLLTYETGETTHYLPDDSTIASGFYHLKVQLPQHITCSQCVLQWRYRTGKKSLEERKYVLHN